MKNDLKNTAIATAIYLGLLIIGAILFIANGLIVARYPVVGNLVQTFGIIFYLVLFGYGLVRWVIMRKSGNE